MILDRGDFGGVILDWGDFGWGDCGGVIMSGVILFGVILSAHHLLLVATLSFLDLYSIDKSNIVNLAVLSR